MQPPGSGFGSGNGLVAVGSGRNRSSASGPRVSSSGWKQASPGGAFGRSGPRTPSSAERMLIEPNGIAEPSMSRGHAVDVASHPAADHHVVVAVLALRPAGVRRVAPADVVVRLRVRAGNGG